MGVTHLAAICRTLIRQGKPGDTPAAVIESGTLAVAAHGGRDAGDHRRGCEPQGRAPPCSPGRRVGRRAAGRADVVRAPSRSSVSGSWSRVPGDEGSRAAAALEALGAEVLLAPTVEVRPITDPAPLDAAIDRLASYDWLVFTSANGVRFFLPRLEARGRDLRALGHLKTRGDRSGDRGGPGQVPPARRPRARVLSLGGPGGGPRPSVPRAAGSCSPGPIEDERVLKDELDQLADVDQVAVYHNADADRAARIGRRANPGRHGRLDHADQLGDHRAAARALAGSGPPADRPRDPAGEPEPGDVGDSRGRSAGTSRSRRPNSPGTVGQAWWSESPDRREIGMHTGACGAAEVAPRAACASGAPASSRPPARGGTPPPG